MKMKTKHIKNLWDAAKAVLTGKKSLNDYIKKEKSFQINNLSFHLKN